MDDGQDLDYEDKEAKDNNKYLAEEGFAEFFGQCVAETTPR